MRRAITSPAIRAADALVMAGGPPIYPTSLLDAISAFEEQDFRRAALYAAISIEVISNITLDAEFKGIAAGGDPEGRLRLVRIPSAQGLVEKDPIYDWLKGRAGIRELLHELPLYVERRSLLLDKPNLYQRALALHKLRNFIVHSGVPDPAEPGMGGQVDEEAARRAVVDATEVFRWWGHTDDYVFVSSPPFLEMAVLDDFGLDASGVSESEKEGP